MSLTIFIRSLFLEGLSDFFISSGISSESLEISKCKDSNFGDYQCNSCMKWARKLGITPMQVANNVAEAVGKISEFSKVSVSFPGFVNVQISDGCLSELLSVWKPSISGLSGHNIALDFSSPNIAKEMHVGHLRSTVIGDCLGRVFGFMGANLLRVSHVGDWGTQFGMVIAYLELYTIESIPDIQCLLKIYKASKKLFDSDSEFKERARACVVLLQSGNASAIQWWEMICKVSHEHHRLIYNILDVNLTVCGESYYNKLLPSMVKELECKGVITNSEGAKCVFISDIDLPFMLVKSDGGYTYATTDLAAIRHRVNDWNASRIVYVTDSGQALHFRLLFEVARMVGFIPEHVRIDHVPFGLVLGKDRKKFKTRSGDCEPLVALLDTAIEKAAEIIVEKGWNKTDERFNGLARAIGISSIKFSDLLNHRNRDYVFSYERMLKFEGKTAPFLMYAHVRASSILKKSNVLCNDNVKLANLVSCFDEKILCETVLRFDETLQRVADELTPNVLADYVYDVARAINRFCDECRVVDSDREKERLFLLTKSVEALGIAMNLLGIIVVDEM